MKSFKLVVRIPPGEPILAAEVMAETREQAVAVMKDAVNQALMVEDFDSLTEKERGRLISVYSRKDN